MRNKSSESCGVNYRKIAEQNAEKLRNNRTKTSPHLEDLGAKKEN